MPVTKSAIKRMRSNQKRYLVNRSIKSSMRTAIKRVDQAIAGGDFEAAEKALPEAVSRIDRAAKRGVIHSSNASRKASRLTRRLNAARAAAQS